MLTTDFDLQLTIIKTVNFILLLGFTLFTLVPVIQYKKEWGINKFQLEILRVTSSLLIMGIYVNAYNLHKDMGTEFLLWSIIINWSLLILNIGLLILNRDKIHIHYYEFK